MQGAPSELSGWMRADAQAASSSPLSCCLLLENPLSTSGLLFRQGLVPVTAAGLLLPLGEGPVWGDSRGPAAAFSVRVWAFVPGSNLEKL